MNRICSECAESVKAKAKVCKHCGHRFSDWAEMQERVRQNEKKNIEIGVVFIEIGLVIFAIAFFYFFKGFMQEVFIQFDIGTKRSNEEFWSFAEKAYWAFLIIGIPVAKIRDHKKKKASKQ